MTRPSSTEPAPPSPSPPPGCPAHAASGAVPLSGPGFQTEPQAVYRGMRRDHGPVVPVELPGGFPAWLVIGYRELHQVTSDGELFPRDVGLWNQWPHIPDDWPLLPMVGRPLPSIYFSAGRSTGGTRAWWGRPSKAPIRSRSGATARSWRTG